MLLLDELGQEHRLVDEVAGSLVRFSQKAAAGDIEPSDVADFVRFFRVFVAGFHHQREEETLFPALVDRAEVPKDRGPLPAIAADHREAVRFVDALEAASGDPTGSRQPKSRRPARLGNSSPNASRPLTILITSAATGVSCARPSARPAPA